MYRSLIAIKLRAIIFPGLASAVVLSSDTLAHSDKQAISNVPVHGPRKLEVSFCFPPLLLISPYRLIGGLKRIFTQALLQNEPFIGNKVERDDPRAPPLSSADAASDSETARP